MDFGARHAENATTLRRVFVLASFLSACAPSADPPFTGPYPVDDVLVEIDALDAHYCECAIAYNPDPPNTVAECDADYPSSWAPGTANRMCLVELGHDDEWRESHIFSCLQLGIDDAHDRLCDYVDPTSGRINFFSGAAAPCGELWQPFFQAFTECTMDATASSSDTG